LYILNRKYARDVTNRNLLHYRGISIEKNDDKGTVFPKLNELKEDELEYLWNNFDSLNNSENGKIVGYLKEFFLVQN
jgi:hypothetical protein